MNRISKEKLNGEATGNPQCVVSICYSEIPNYLHSSCFFKALDSDEEDGVITVPVDCFQANDAIQNKSEFEQLLRVVRFWGLDHLPANFYIYCSECPDTSWKSKAKEMLGSHFYCLLVQYQQNHRSLGTVLRTNCPELVTRWTKFNPPNSVNAINAINQVIAAGDLTLLHKLHTDGYPWHTQSSLVAAYYGPLECLQYVHSHGCELNPFTLSLAAQGGQLECMKYAHQHGCIWKAYVCTNAARNGHLPCLQYAHEQGCPWDEDVLYNAVRMRHKDCLQYALQHACPGGLAVSLYTARWGDLPGLQLLHECGQGWHVDVVEEAVSAHQVDTLRYALQHGCPYKAKVYMTALWCDDGRCLGLLEEYAHLRVAF